MGDDFNNAAITGLDLFRLEFVREANPVLVTLEESIIQYGVLSDHCCGDVSDEDFVSDRVVWGWILVGGAGHSHSDVLLEIWWNHVALLFLL